MPGCDATARALDGGLEVARKAGHLPLGTFDRDLAKTDGAQRL